MGSDVIRFKNKNPWVNSHKRKLQNRGDRFDVDEKRLPPCASCGRPNEFYKWDSCGNIIVSCTNFYCVKNKEHENSITTKLSKLLKAQMLHSRYWTDYLGGYYGEHYDPRLKYTSKSG